MTFRLVDSDWTSEFADALRIDRTRLRIVCPFIKLGALARLLLMQPERVQVITRFSLHDFADRVSDIDALRHLLHSGAGVRGIRNLHAKLYLFGSSRAIVTSANLTDAGLRKNPEFGAVLEEPAAMRTCLDYFNRLWRLGGSDLTPHQLDEWDRILENYRATGARLSPKTELPDFGADTGINLEPSLRIPPIFADPPQAFVKFLGEGTNRVPLSFATIDEIDRAGCHWALAYPDAAGRRPTGVERGAMMFISRLVKGPDIRVFGRAVALEHEEWRDDATPADIDRRPWKSRWPRYIRVHHAQFVAGTMENGVSLAQLMNSLGSESFASTQRNAARGTGNTNPRRAFMQQPAVKLSNDAFHWLNDRLQSAFDTHGQVPRHLLTGLDWPELPVRPAQVPEFTQEAFDGELHRMLDEARRVGRTSARVVALDLHRNVVGGAKPNRMRMACNAMWRLWRHQGSISKNVINTTESRQSSTIEIEFILE